MNGRHGAVLQGVRRRNGVRRGQVQKERLGVSLRLSLDVQK